MSRPSTDGGTMAAFLQSAMSGAAEIFVRSMVTQPARVEQPMDSNGVYEDYLLVHLASGIVLRVQVTVETEPSTAPPF